MAVVPRIIASCRARLGEAHWWHSGEQATTKDVPFNFLK